jgi:Porin PorA
MTTQVTPLITVPTPPAPPPRRRHGHRWLLGAGIVLIAGAVTFAVVGIPALVRLPLSTDVTTHYKGTFSLFVDRTSMAALPQPTNLALSIDRHVKVQSGNFSTAIVTEDDSLNPGPLHLHEHFQYQMNRRGMDFDNSPKTVMYGQPSNANLAGAYRINFPLDTTSTGKYRAWNVETDQGALLTNTSGTHSLAGVTGVKVIDFTSKVTGVPSANYLAWMYANGFPKSITTAQLEDEVRALGGDLPAALTQLQPLLTPTQQTQVTQAVAAEVPLNYTYLYDGVVSVEPHTGTIIRAGATDEELHAAPSLTGWSDVRALMASHPQSPAVQATLTAFDRLAAAPPQLVQRDSYMQTVASSQDLANKAHDSIATMDRLNVVPWIIGGVGVVALLAGWWLARRNRRSV